MGELLLLATITAGVTGAVALSKVGIRLLVDVMAARAAPE